jgi:hypothetical protein
MIGAAVGIAGGCEMTPQAMARLLRFADPRPRVFLAIDDAHTLSHRSLGYLTLMTELLASEAPILQIVLAAGPSLLDTLAQPEFETLRSRLCRPLFETIQTLRGKRANGARLGSQEPTPGLDPAHLAHILNGGPAALSPRGHGIVRPAVHAAVGLVAISSLAAIGYIAFSALIGPTLPPISSLNDAPDRFPTPSGPSQSLAQLAPRQIDGGIDPLIDETVDAVASGSIELTSALLERISKLGFSASPDRPKLMLALQDRLAARMGTAAVAGRIDEARRLEGVFGLVYSAIGRPDLPPASSQRSFRSPPTALPGASGTSTIDGPAQQREIAQRPGFPPNGLVVSAEQPGGASDGDGAALPPNVAAPAPPSAATEQSLDGAPAISANSTALDGPSTLSAARRRAAGDGDRAALPPSGASLAPPSAAREQNVDDAPRARLAKMPPVTPDDHKVPVVVDLPTFAPVRVVLNVARGDEGSAADIQHALVAAGVETDLVPVDAREPTPSIGYYFRSDRNAAAGVSQLLAPLLGTVDPVALRIRGSIPEPGTIEIAIPK